MSRILALQARRLIDGTGGPAIDNAVVIVDGESITAVGPADTTTIPPEAERIDLGDRTLLPGFIDAHSHATINPGLRGIIGQLEGSERAESEAGPPRSEKPAY